MQADSAWKLADFGYTSEETAGRLRDATTAKKAEIYRAPELVLSQNLQETVDIWSMGCILWEMVAGKPAFDSDGAMIEWYFQKIPFDVTIDDTFDVNQTSISETVARMLQREPSKRPSAATLYDEFRRQCSALATANHQFQKRENGLLEEETGNKSQGRPLVIRSSW